MKRVFDIICSFLGLIVLLPVFLIIMILIKIRMPGHIFFNQIRVGRYGKFFTIHKFRTMIENHGGSSISVKGDGRVTSLGSQLRKYKLDELPELWNVLKGEMSLVGPRPDVPDFIDRLVGDQKQILNIRPGITSPASLKYVKEEELVSSSENPEKFYTEVIWPDKVRMNLIYCQTRSFLGDIRIIFNTIFG